MNKSTIEQLRRKALKTARNNKGGNPAIRKLNQSQVIEIFQLTIEGKKQREIVKIFAEKGISISGSTVSAYLNGKHKVPNK